MDNWIIVSKKKKIYKKIIQREKLDKNYVIEQLLELFSFSNIVYDKPVAVFLFGSTAKGTNSKDSDVDILVIWNKKVPENILDIKNNLIMKFNRKVDLVCMILGNVLYDHNSSKNFIDNVVSDSISIFGDINDVYISRLVGKI
jgi:predicted nucleotidyltransferase